MQVSPAPVEGTALVALFARLSIVVPTRDEVHNLCAKFAPYPQDVLEACFNAANETYAEINGTNAAFKKVYDALVAFRADAYLWAQFSEYTFDTFMMGQQRKRAL